MEGNTIGRKHGEFVKYFTSEIKKFYMHLLFPLLEKLIPSLQNPNSVYEVKVYEVTAQL